MNPRGYHVTAILTRGAAGRRHRGMLLVGVLALRGQHVRRPHGVGVDLLGWRRIARGARYDMPSSKLELCKWKASNGDDSDLENSVYIESQSRSSTLERYAHGSDGKTTISALPFCSMHIWKDNHRPSIWSEFNMVSNKWIRGRVHKNAW